jgi:hypothetical protein
MHEGHREAMLEADYRSGGCRHFVREIFSHECDSVLVDFLIHDNPCERPGDGPHVTDQEGGVAATYVQRVLGWRGGFQQPWRPLVGGRPPGGADASALDMGGGKVSPSN